MSTRSLAFDLLDAHVIAGRADDVALTSAAGELTFAQLLHESAAVAGGLRALAGPEATVGESDVVTVDLSGRERVVTILAVLRCGARTGPDGRIRVLPGDDGRPMVVAGDQEVPWETVRELGQSDPAAARRTDAEDYRAWARAAHHDIVNPLLSGQFLSSDD